MRAVLRSISGFLLTSSPLTVMAQVRPPRAPNDSQTVVFVCEHGTVKSVVAMAYFAELAKQRHLPLRAISRGTNPDPSVPSLVLDGLRADGLPLGSFTPTRFSPADFPSAIAIISFDQPSVATLVAGRLPTDAWDGMPAVSDNYVLAREAIRRRVAGLVDSLAKHQAGRAQPPHRPCSAQDSVGWLKPSDAGFAEAQQFRRRLTGQGFVVHCVIRSTFQSFIWTWPEAAFLTDRGDIEVRFFPAPRGAEQLRVDEVHTGSGWRYSFPGHAGAGDTLYAVARQYFIRAGRWLVLVTDPDLAAELRRALP